ncbi:WD40 repeat domain-containing protein [Streptomyces montanisoli]|uniref:WD40 repeat domain-containing protein n=1 Tax=Streptomyces montanisoli TaxID=2798581 RepID=UPI0027DC8218|nr:WD40 repeat domain-containing protein [Streptomyces montanisoli]
MQRWDLPSGMLLEATEELALGTIWGLDSYATGDGKILLVGAGNDHLLHRWDAESGTKAGAPLAGHRSSVKCVASKAVPGRGTLIASGSDDGTVRRWDAANGEFLGVSKVINADILDVDLLVSKSGVFLLTCGDSDGVLHRWDAATGQPLGAPIETGEMVGSLVSVDVVGEPMIIASSESGLVRQWHALTGHLVDESPAGMSVAAMVQADGRVLLATGTEDGEISLRMV